MRLVSGIQIAEGKIQVFRVVENAENLSQEELKAGYLTNKEIPQFPYEKGKKFTLCYDTINDEFYFISENRPLTMEEIQQDLNEKINLLLQMQLESEGII